MYSTTHYMLHTIIDKSVMSGKVLLYAEQHRYLLFVCMQIKLQRLHCYYVVKVNAKAYFTVSPWRKLLRIRDTAAC